MLQDLCRILFRTIREALLNVVKHAGVKIATVVLHKKGKYVLVRARDKGTGMDLSTFDRGRRLTKYAIREGLVSLDD